MVRGEKSLLAVFRRRNSCRELGEEGGGAEEDHHQDKDDGPVEERKEEVDHQDFPQSTTAETKCTSETTATVVERTTSFCDGAAQKEDEANDDVSAKPTDVVESVQQEPQSQDDTEKESESASTVDQVDPACKTSESTKDSKLGATKNSGSSSAQDGTPPPPEEAVTWARDTKRLGWTPGRVKLVDKHRFVLEPVVAIGDALDDVCLDECLVRAMSGKRGSFSSERSVKTDESEGSETKRARRVWSSVFRMRHGPAK